MTNTKTETYRPGDIIEYRTFMYDRATGRGVRTVRVTSREEDIAKGHPGFDGVTLEEGVTKVWGYDHQIVRVVAWKDCPGFDELPVRARIDLTGARPAEYGLAEGQTHVEASVTDLFEGQTGRRYAQYLWRDEYFMAPLADVEFGV